MTSLDSILAERKTQHGDFTDHARITQLLKFTVDNELRQKPGHLSYAQREAVEMILHKIGRIVAGDPNHKDHWDDIAGYARLVSERIAP